jgi:hypothetical protein
VADRLAVADVELDVVRGEDEVAGLRPVRLLRLAHHLQRVAARVGGAGLDVARVHELGAVGAVALVLRRRRVIVRALVAARQVVVVADGRGLLRDGHDLLAHAAGDGVRLVVGRLRAGLSGGLELRLVRLLQLEPCREAEQVAVDALDEPAPREVHRRPLGERPEALEQEDLPGAELERVGDKLEADLRRDLAGVP